MAKDKGKSKAAEPEELSVDEAANIVQKLSKPDRKNEEFELLKQASATLLNEVKPGFEFEEDEDDGGGGGSGATEKLKEAPGFLEQIGTTVQALGPAGMIALGSAAYFQIDTVVEETRTVATVAEEKWEEVKFEHPNINWDDPLAGFTTIIGMGDIEIDLEPPTPVEPQPKDLNESTTIPEESESGGEEEQAQGETEESTAVDNEPDEDTEEEVVEEEEQEEPKKKKKKGLFGLFGGDDDEEEEAEEESEEETDEPVEESTDEETEEPVEEESAEEESSEPEPEAEEQVEEKPKKKSGGLFSFLTGGDDESDEEQGEDTTNDEPSQTETTEETQSEPSTETDDGETEIEVADEGDADVEQPSEKKSSGGGLFAALFGNNDNTEEVEENEVSTDEPTIEVADSGNEDAPPPVSEDEPEIEIDTLDEIKPHAMVEVADTEVDALPEIDDVEIEVVATDSGESFEINLAEMSIDDLEFLSDAFDNGEIEVADIAIDDTIEETVEQVVIEQILTPIDTGNGDVNVVSPATGGDIDWSGIFGPSAPGYDSGDRDATPI
jgi:hypothetical protein